MDSSYTLPQGIIIAATPLGNIDDASPRLKVALERATVVAAEDTRRTKNLAQALGVVISGQIVSNFDHNEASRVPMLLDAARTGTVLVVTDAGMPSVSDPGFPLVEAAYEAGVPVTCFPGPSAVPTALALSGFGVGHFIFDGFAPRKKGQREAWLQSLVGEKRAVCFFESPHRIAATLADIATILGDSRRVAVCRELTKTYEEVRRGSASELATWAADGVKGEISVVIEGATAGVVEVDFDSAVDEVVAKAEAGMRLKAAAEEVATATGLSKKELYNAAVAKK
ncbi:MAG: 16S rRNA (cytidine(1402)-2'-O)-methyltransferase [Corynebacterium sp.]|nr:16S rRNA (cytidine(1402)-2'-O)-methyltransferase [Corynebacterium sp.]